MTIPEESPPQTKGTWYRHIFHAPPGAPWLPQALEKLQGAPALPGLRDLRSEQDGNLSIEEYYTTDLLPLSAYLTKSAAPLWAFVSIVQQSLAGLARLHECGLMHGAISPETLLINNGGNVVLANAGGGVRPAEWKQGVVGAGRVLHPLAVRDLRDLGRVFRVVLGGDAEKKMTVSRPDIAPLVSEWIDWLAAPETGREPQSAGQAESVFADIRAGRAGQRPWQDKLELPPEVEFGGTKQQVPLTEEERKKLLRAAADAHGSGLSLRAQILIALLILVLAGGGIFLTNYFFADHSQDSSPDKPVLKLPEGTPGLAANKLSEESGDLFIASGGDVEPLVDTGETIAALMKIVGSGLKPGALWQKELLRRKKEGEENPAGGPSAPDTFLYDSLIFPAMGKASAGVEPGDYYIAWRTNRFVMTPEESSAVQAAVLRSTRYCGVRLLAWTVLPNQAAVVLRVLPRQPLSDEKLERRIAILRGDKAAAGVIAQINAKLKAGDDDGADEIRKKWRVSMGSASGFFSVIKTVSVVEPDALQGRPLWQDKPLHLSFLNPATPDVLQAASIVDSAAVRGKLVENASSWPLCSLRAALHNYGPALRAISVLMQRNPQAFLPVPAKEEILKSLLAYRRYLGDVPPEPESKAEPASKSAPPEEGGPEKQEVLAPGQ